MVGIINQKMYCGDRNDKTLLWEGDGLTPSLWLGIDETLIAVAVAVHQNNETVSYTIHNGVE